MFSTGEAGMWRVRLDEFMGDCRYAFRALRRSPAFAATVLVMLGVGIGANTTLFSLTDQVLLRALPVEQPSELVLFDGPGVFQGTTLGDQTFSTAMFLGLRDASPQVLTGLVARHSTGATIDVAGLAERAVAELVSGDYFTTLRVRPALGRRLQPSDDIRAAPPAVVLSHSYWQRRFGGDPRVLGRIIRVNTHPMTVVGVSARGFHGVDIAAPADVFVPLALAVDVVPASGGLDEWRTRWLNVMGRLAPGVSRERAAAALDVPYRQLLREDVETARLEPDERTRFLEKSVRLYPGARGLATLRSRFFTPLLVLMGMVGLVLLIVCANIASLLLARAASQQKETAVRLALGASRTRLIHQRLTESLVLAAAGCALGLLIAWWGTGLLIDVLPVDRAAMALSAEPDLRVILFAIGAAAATAVLFGIAPALHATKPALTESFAAGSRTVAGGGAQARFRKGVVVAQVALSLLLLAGTGLFARSLHNLRTLDPGFVAANLLHLSLDPALSGYVRETSITLFAELEAELRALPGVIGAATATQPIMADRHPRRTVRVQGYEATAGVDMSSGTSAVGPGYFATMGIPLLAGREFVASDIDGAPQVAIINETMARHFWENEDPIGRRFGWSSSTTGDEIEVIGVVADSKFANIREDATRFFYTPYMQGSAVGRHIVYVRSRPGMADISMSVRNVVQRLAPGLPIVEMGTMQAQVDESLFTERLVATLSILFGTLATVLAALGLYGVVSYLVARRTREVGIRIALGAQRATVLWMVLREAVILTGAGLLIGLPAAMALSRLVTSQLFGVSPTDPLTLGGATATLALVALLAGYLPARHATRLDPMLALRQD